MRPIVLSVLITVLVGCSSHSSPSVFAVPGSASPLVKQSGSDGLEPRIARFPSASNTWTSGAPMPTQRFEAGAAALGTKIYVMGGYNGTGVLAANEIYDTTTNSWSTGAPMPTPRYALAVTAANGFVYAIGGENSTTLALPTVEKYDPAQDTWTPELSMGNAISSSTAPVVHIGPADLVYLMGGLSLSGRTSDVQRYFPKRNDWQTLGPIRIAKYSAYIGAIGTDIVVAGGLANHTISDNEVYNPNRNGAKKAAPMPSPRSTGCAAGIGGSLYAAGGIETTRPLSRLDAYDLLTDTWTSLAPMPKKVIGSASATVNGLFYCIGGSNSAAASPSDTFYNNIWIYQP